jgi:hypothetical protein
MNNPLVVAGNGFAVPAGYDFGDSERFNASLYG